MKIIILDDSKTMRKIISAYLLEVGVYSDEIYPFENGYEALDFIKINGADIIFSDVKMPYMDGYDFAYLVFKILPTLQKSFFAISGESNHDSFMKMNKVGVHYFLKRPINLEYFKEYILPGVLECRAAEMSA